VWNPPPGTLTAARFLASQPLITVRTSTSSYHARRPRSSPIIRAAYSHPRACKFLPISPQSTASNGLVQIHVYIGKRPLSLSTPRFPLRHGSRLPHRPINLFVTNGTKRCQAMHGLESSHLALVIMPGESSLERLIQASSSGASDNQFLSWESLPMLSCFVNYQCP
jgi:hypothetical protein